MGRMPRRAAFTLIEVLMALVVLAAAASALAATLTADRRMRDAATARVDAARRVRDRLERFAARCGVTDTSGSAVASGLSDAWRAAPVAGGWRFTDSVRAATGAEVLAVAATVRCAP